MAPDLPQVMDDVFRSLRSKSASGFAPRCRSTRTWSAWMNFDDVQVRSDVTLEVVLRYLRDSTSCRRRRTSCSSSTATSSCSAYCRSTG
jgi:hypothetical protein